MHLSKRIVSDDFRNRSEALAEHDTAVGNCALIARVPKATMDFKLWARKTCICRSGSIMTASRAQHILTERDPAVGNCGPTIRVTKAMMYSKLRARRAFICRKKREAAREISRRTLLPK